MSFYNTSNPNESDQNLISDTKPSHSKNSAGFYGILFLIIIAIGIGGYSLYKLLSIQDMYHRANEVYSDFEDQYVLKEDNERIKHYTRPEKTLNLDGSESTLIPTFVWDYEKAHEEYPDIVGYIYQDKTEHLSYPILQGETNNTYLRHLITGEYHVAGSIFVDSNFPYALKSNYCIVYGHNMKNHSMFGSLLNYRDPEYYADHKTFDIYVEDKHYQYQVFSVLTSKADGDMFRYLFDSEEEFVDFFNEVKEKSDYEVDDGLGPVTADDHFICLSTCTYDLNYAYRYTIIIRRGAEYDDSLYQGKSNKTTGIQK